MNAARWPQVCTVTLVDLPTGRRFDVEVTRRPVEEIPADSDVVDRRCDELARVLGPDDRYPGRYLLEYEPQFYGLAGPGEVFEVLPATWWRGLAEEGGR